MANNVVAEILGSLEVATTSADSVADFRIDMNCQNGNHYMRQRRGSGSGRRKNSGTNQKETYRYLGIAEVVAGERDGYYKARWQEYKSNHKCHYQQ